MKKIDLKQDLKHLYAPSAKQIEIVVVPEFQFAMIDGQIEPGLEPNTSPSFQQAIEAIYGIAYTLKFMSKQREQDPIDYTVMALEGLWDVEEGEFDINRKDNWLWTLMIMQPKHIDEDMFAQARQHLQKKKDNPAIEKLRLERFHEGLSIQTMHIGPYSEEPATVVRMESYARENGYIMRGCHHEIYLGDPRRAQPEKLKTILRHPVNEAS
ncbi:MAG: GyrI-like domain-containing protein [Anaerolineales bacterium]|nr:GyrI-like domain-containing protein [Anaerolineales bacterium]